MVFYGKILNFWNEEFYWTYPHIFALISAGSLASNFAGEETSLFQLSPRDEGLWPDLQLEFYISERNN